MLDFSRGKETEGKSSDEREHWGYLYYRMEHALDLLMKNAEALPGSLLRLSRYYGLLAT